VDVYFQQGSRARASTGRGGVGWGGVGSALVLWHSAVCVPVRVRACWLVQVLMMLALLYRCWPAWRCEREQLLVCRRVGAVCVRARKHGATYF
jgi:hypothetical protein